MFEVVFIQESAVLHALPVKHIATYGIVSQHAGCPLSELCGTNAVHAVAYADDGIEVVKHCLALYLSVSFGSNYFHFGNSSFFSEFALFINIFEVFANSWYIHIKKDTHCFLSTPHGLILIIHLNALLLTL